MRFSGSRQGIERQVKWIIAIFDGEWYDLDAAQALQRTDLHWREETGHATATSRHTVARAARTRLHLRRGRIRPGSPGAPGFVSGNPAHRDKAKRRSQRRPSEKQLRAHPRWQGRRVGRTTGCKAATAGRSAAGMPSLVPPGFERQVVGQNVICQAAGLIGQGGKGKHPLDPAQGLPQTKGGGKAATRSTPCTNRAFT